MEHSERKIMYSKFDKLETGGILISTDVASRGLDFKSVKWVVQFDIHPSLKEYANRIGRTARLNEHGNSLIFINEDTEALFIDCLKTFGAEIQEMNRFKMLQEFTTIAQKKYHREGKGTRVFTKTEVEIEDEKFEILLFLKMLVRDTLKNDSALDKLELQSYNSGNKARYGFGIQLRKLFKKCEIKVDGKIKIAPRHKTNLDEKKFKKQRLVHEEFEKGDSKYKDYAKLVKLSGRDTREKDLMKLKYDRMNSAMRKVIKNSNQEFV
mmetsp:Transcript_19311/g.22441  ORF Transcript_19311/g.22441 Transcript_19311/m.22441 type:complete len:266 (+) Transcript_19311:1573-2370(+)